MIEKIEFTQPDTVGFEAKGELTAEDYTRVVKPVLEEARADKKKLRLLAHLGRDFKGFTPGAAVEDFKLGFRHARTLERFAVVTDITWLRQGSRFIGSLVPCTVKTFKNEDLHNAKAWLNSGEIALNHHLDEENGVLTVELSGRLTSENFEVLTHTVDAWLKQNGELNGIVVHAKKFPGWEDLGSVISHFDFVKNHQRKIKRVALAVDGTLAGFVPEFAKHFVKAEIKHFGYDGVKEAQDWAKEKT